MDLVVGLSNGIYQSFIWKKSGAEAEDIENVRFINNGGYVEKQEKPSLSLRYSTFCR
jgi:hypothetical protein